MIVLLLLALLAQERAVLRVVGTKISAPNAMVKPIMVTVTIRNESKLLIDGLTVRVVLTPMYRTGQRGKPPGGEREPVDTMFEPWVLDAPVPPLSPGQTRSLVVETPFLARTAFTTTGQVFTVENLIPNLKRTVPVHVDVELILSPSS